MQVKWTTAGTHEGVAMIQREAFRSQWGWVSSRSHRGCFASVWFEWLEKRLTQPGVMIQIQWDRQTDVERGSDALTWTPPPSCALSEGLSSIIFLHFCQIHRKNTLVPTQLFSRFCLFTAYGQIYMLLPYGCTLLRTSRCRSGVCLWMWVIESTQRTTWNINRWRWRCPCAGIGCGDVS